MYRKLSLIAILLALAAIVRANDILQITEISGPVDSLVGTYNGAPLNIAVTGPDFTVTLPTGYLFSSSILGQSTMIADADDPIGVNLISIPVTDPAVFLAWISDVPLPGAFPSSFTFTNAGTNPNGSVFDLIVSNGAGQGVPDGGSTFMLLGGALVTMGGVTRRWMR